MGHFSDVWVAAIACLVDFVKVEKSNALQDLERLLRIAATDPESLIRYKVIRLLTKNPPFRKAYVKIRDEKFYWDKCDYFQGLEF